MRHDDSCGVSSVVLAFLVGGVVGAGLAMLFSPYSGEDAREKLRELKNDLYDRKDDISQEAKEKIADTVQKGKGFIEEQKGVISSAIEAGKGAYKKEKEKQAKADA
jgi:gas vesicle protein